MCLCALIGISQAAESSGPTAVVGDRILFDEPPSPTAFTFVGDFSKDVPLIITGAPYSGIGTSEVVWNLKSFSDQPMVKVRKVRYARDGRGRTRMEELTATGERHEEGVVRIDDPVAARRYRIDPQELLPLQVLPLIEARDSIFLRWVAPAPREAAATRFLEGMGVAELRAPGEVVSKTLSLGDGVVAGVRANGRRIENIIPGTEHPVRVISEQWFSADLGLVVMAMLSVDLGPDACLQTRYRLQLVRGEPDAALFKVPQ